ncbi:MAG TPA: ABC transporter permease subunit [Acetobacteraceae bacterium]|nr:ABC transporter permease subunit [Acetobacteraceae bacterium]
MAEASAAAPAGPGRRGRMAGWLLLLPLMVFLAAAFYYPIGYTLADSMRGAHGITLAHYTAFLASSAGLRVLELTLVLSVAATVLSVALSLPLALLLRRRFAGKGAIQFLMMLPITIPSLVGALGLVILYDRTGWLNYALVAALHILRHPLAIDYTVPGIVLFYIWMFFPYGGLVIMSGLGAIDPAIEEAGRVAGGSPFYVFRTVVLPLLKPSLWAGSIMVFLQCFGAFSVPLIAGGNHQPLAVKIYTVATVFLDWPQASAMAVVMGMVQVVLVIAYRRLDAGTAARRAR